MMKIGSINRGIAVKGHLIRHILLYSTSTLTSGCVTNPTVYMNYLISLGYSRQQAEPISLKLAHRWQKKKNHDKKSIDVPFSSKFTQIWKKRGAETVSDFNFIANAHAVVSYLRHIGCRESHIRCIVSKAPNILFSNVNTTIKPKVKGIRNFGFSLCQIVSLVESHPVILFMGLNSSIVPSLQFWTQFRSVTCIEDITDLMMFSKFWFNRPSEIKVMMSNMNLLRDYGVTIYSIKDWMHQRGSISLSSLMLSDKLCFKNTVMMVGETFGVPPDHFDFLALVERLLRKPITEDIIDSRKQLFKSFGWTEAHVRELFRVWPWCVYKSEDGIKEVLPFLMNKVGCEPSYVATRPKLLYKDVKTELTPRYEVFQILKEKGLLTDQDFGLAMRLAQRALEKMFVKPFEDVYKD